MHMSGAQYKKCVQNLIIVRLVEIKLPFGTKYFVRCPEKRDVRLIKFFLY